MLVFVLFVAAGVVLITTVLARLLMRAALLGIVLTNQSLDSLETDECIAVDI
ncbi:MAG: hypothetical protein LIO96_08940 [Lachnospiraceae bacterium]|nr:hypothetical protein [Lachnospiraceae bacterium]